MMNCVNGLHGFRPVLASQSPLVETVEPLVFDSLCDRSHGLKQPEAKAVLVLCILGVRIVGFRQCF